MISDTVYYAFKFFGQMDVETLAKKLELRHVHMHKDSLTHLVEDMVKTGRLRRSDYSNFVFLAK